jgi:hypothetical protein
MCQILTGESVQNETGVDKAVGQEEQRLVLHPLAEVVLVAGVAQLKCRIEEPPPFSICSSATVKASR